MITKSYEIEKNPTKFSNFNLFLLYGENFGLKKDIRDIVKIAVKQKNDSIELLSLYETEIILNSLQYWSLLIYKKIIKIK